MNIPYKKQFTFQERKNESSRVLNKFPNKIPIIVEYIGRNNKNNPILDRRKFLVPNDIVGGQFNYVIRKRIKFEPSKSIFLFVNRKILLESHKLMSQVYDQYKDIDGFLYISYSYENTFG
jgi:GABA(A) receptor-associated protein